MPSNTPPKDEQISTNPPTQESYLDKGYNQHEARWIALLLLAAALTPISQLTMAPVLGSVTASTNHRLMVMTSFFFGHIQSGAEGTSRGNWRLLLLPVLAFWVPVLQYFLSPYHGTLGVFGSLCANGFLASHMLAFCTGFAIPRELAAGGLLQHMARGRTARMLWMAFTFCVFLFLEGLFTRNIVDLLHVDPDLTPLHLQFLVALAYSLQYPSPVLAFALPAVYHTIYMNPHWSPAAVDTALQPHNWTLLERQWSNTGYISVLESFESNYRVMRCDHSLLGGEWLLTEDRQNKEGWKTTEPIYAVFQMLEAVRLMQVEPAIPDSEAQALVIGLGIGTAPKAFVAHGIQTTVVELDPVVHDFATRYFDLPSNHTAVIQDAVSWAQDVATAAESPKYDYIIHDVFTGGTEPLPLFTKEFLQNLQSLLTPNGVMAINYAGDPAYPLTKRVFNTIATVFSHQCKIYRDGPPEKHSSKNSNEEEDSDFTNMIVFCRNSPGPLTFRKPRQADYLGSKSRQYYMLPKPEHEIPFPDVVQLQPGSRSDASDSAQHGGEVSDDREQGQGEVLGLGDVGNFADVQRRSAMRHWGIMRKVLPDAVWELW